MSKERLEEIKKRYDSATIVVFEGIDTVNVDVQDLDWLFEQAELRDEQVQRNLQALEKINTLEDIYDRLVSENQRYKQVLEFYADRSIYNFETETDFDAEETRIINEGHIFKDFGERARKALEESK